MISELVHRVLVQIKITPVKSPSLHLNKTPDRKINLAALDNEPVTP